jgi:hypothetical protein
MITTLGMTAYGALCNFALGTQAAHKRLAVVARNLERGDADSAGSTLRTVFVVAVVAAVLTLLGPTIMQAARDANATLGTRP